MELLVTGGLGFIGSNFIRRVLSQHEDYYVTNVDRIGPGANIENLRDLEKNNKYRFVKGDISDRRVVDSVIRNADIVINFAAETHVDRSIVDPSPFIESNVIGTFNLLEEERRLGKPVKHIQISTDEVYGDIATGSFKEIDALGPSNPYSASKAASDMFCRAYHKTYGMNTVITRCTNNFGPYQYPEKLIPKTIIRAFKDLPIPVYGTGKSIRDWIYVQDHCKAIELILEKARPGEIYNISSGHEMPTSKIVKEVLDILGKPHDLVTYVEDRPGHDLRYSVNSTKLRVELGWKPVHGFESALRKTVEWYLGNDWWWRPLITDEVLHPTPWKRK